MHTRTLPQLSDYQHMDEQRACGSSWRRFVVHESFLQVVPPQKQTKNGNAIRTARFNLLTWLPKSLYYQFHRVANVYFVAVAIITCTPLWGGKWEAKVITVLSILLAQALKDGYEDLKRWRDDREENTRRTVRYSHDESAFVELPWKSCSVGDLLLVRRAQPFPSDMLVVASADTSGAFYVCTKSLDGETNLKEKHAQPLELSTLAQAQGAAETAAELLRKGLEVELEAPQVTLSELNCIISIKSKAAGASLTNFALRGTELQNTAWVLGLVCYVGDECKVRLNSTDPPTKNSELERILNRCVSCILVFIFVVATCFVIAACVQPVESDSSCFPVFAKYVVILYAVLPMTLYICFEILHLMIGFQIETDGLMKYDGRYAKARNTSVVEELGQVDFVFSDKTGTLTANEMRFAFCCIGEQVVGPFLKGSSTEPTSPGMETLETMLQMGDSQLTWDFLETLAVCHTVKVDQDGTFIAESPDELALVQAVADAGCAFAGRHISGADIIHTVHGPNGATDHVVAQLLGFTSDRKRMSVVCPAQDGGADVMTKGADNVMCELLAEPLPLAAQHALDTFAKKGYRTLVIARRRIAADAYSDWTSRWQEANAALSGRQERLEGLAREAEGHLQYLGITAVEDRLQDGVPETIASMREAGIRVWVLTGDKVETAVEIAKSCRLFAKDSHILQAVGTRCASEALACLKAKNMENIAPTSLSMVLDGLAVSHMLASAESRATLYQLAARAGSCVCCRLSPMQKRNLVELVHEQDPRSITLSIGDGANDVPMIQGAHIGVGIRGKEGSAAVQASDFSIGQFKFIANLLFCHGRRAYRRVATFLCFFMYKSVVLGWSYIIYAHTVRFAGKLSYPEGLDMIFNPITSCAVVVVMATDFDFLDMEAVRSPSLYRPGHERAYMNVCEFSKWMILATLQGVLAWTLPMRLLTTDMQRKDQDDKYWEASFTAFTIVIIIVHLRLLILAKKHLRLVGVAMIALEVIAYVCAVAFLATQTGALGKHLVGVPQRLLYASLYQKQEAQQERNNVRMLKSMSLDGKTPLLCLIVVPCVALLLDFLINFIYPYLAHLARKLRGSTGISPTSLNLVELTSVRSERE